MAVRVKREPGPALSSDSGAGGGGHRICYVCGGPGGAFSLHSRPRERGSYFAFLEQHEVPYGAERPSADDGLVQACMLCYSLLGQQWESFERNRTPHAKRLYWLKRADNGHYVGAEMRVQGEYAAQMIGVSPDAALVPSSSNSHSHYGGGGSSGSPIVRHQSVSAREQQPGNGGSAHHHQHQSSATAAEHRLPQSSSSRVINDGNYYATRDSGPGSRSGSVVMATSSSAAYSSAAPAHPHIQLQRDLEREQQEATASVLLDLRSGGVPAGKMSASSVGGANNNNNTPCASPRSFKSTRGGECDVAGESFNSSGVTPANGVLDLSMPDKNEKTEACYLCGDEVLRSDLVNVYAKPVANCPFFPSLMMHPRQSHSRPMDYSGCVQACVCCHQHLLQQWDVFQRKNVPHSERRYQLRKLSAAGPPPPLRAPLPSHLSPPPAPPPPSLSHANSSPPPASLAPPPPPDDFICFLCGQEFAWSMRHFLYAGANSEGEPPLPFLERVKPSRGALPLSATGRALACASCHRAIHRQRHAYQGIAGESDPIGGRSQPPLPPAPSLHQHQQRGHKMAPIESRCDATNSGSAVAPPGLLRESLPASNSTDRPVLLSCQACRRPIQRGHLKVIDFLPHREPGRTFHPYTADGESGGVPVCAACFAVYVAQWEAFEEETVPHPHRRYVLAAPPPPPPPPPPLHQQQSQHPYRPISGDGTGTVGATTYPAGSSLHTDMGLRIRVPSPAEQDYPHGQQHGHHQQHNNQLQQQQSLLTTVSSVSSSPVSTISVGHPPVPCAMDLTGVVMAAGRSVTTTSRSNVSSPTGCAVQSRSSLPPSQSSSSAPARGSFVCYVCGLRSRGNERPYAVRTYPSKTEETTVGGSASGAPVPFFPSLTLHATPPDAAPAAEDGTVATCVFCFHALLLQWTAFEVSPRRPADRNPWSRAYDCHDFVCYICGVTTYRKRVRRISVADFPFLVEHPRPAGALVLDGGDGVAVCLMCCDTLSAQWNDFERMKMPLELRKYNWIAAPPPPEDDCRSSNNEAALPGVLQTTGNADGEHHQHSAADDEQLDGFSSSRRSIAGQESSSRQSSLGLVHGSKPIPPLTGSLSAVSNGTGQKLSPHHSVSSSNVPPLSQSSPGGGGHHANAKSSSFAAALRKLAEQATDPVDKDLSPVSSASPPCPVPGPKRAPPPLILSTDMHHPVAVSSAVSLSLASSFASPPPAMVASSQSQHLIYSDGRKVLHGHNTRHDLYDDHANSDLRHGDRDRDPNDGGGSIDRLPVSHHHSPLPTAYSGERESSELHRRMSTGYMRGQQHQHSSVGEFSPVEKGGGGGGEDGGSNTTHSMTYGERGREELRYSTNNGLLGSHSQSLSHVRLHPQSLPSGLQPPRLDDHYVSAGSSSSSFQPYRCADDGPARLPTHVTSPYEGASTAFGYHPSAFMSHPLPQPPFRLEEHMYLERYGLLRPPMFPVSHHHGVLPPTHHALPFMSGSSRYAPDLMQHPLGLVSPPVNHLMAQERLKLEDVDQQQRRDFYQDSSERRNERKLSSSDGTGAPGDRDRKLKSPWSGHNRMSESPGGIGSITQGTPRELVVQHKGPAASWPGSSSPPPAALPSPSGQTHSYGGSHGARNLSEPPDHHHQQHRRSGGQSNSIGSAKQNHYNAMIAGNDRLSFPADATDTFYRGRPPGDYANSSNVDPRQHPIPSLSSRSPNSSTTTAGSGHHVRSGTGSRGSSAFHHVSSVAPVSADAKSPTTSWESANGPREWENGLRHEYFGSDARSSRDVGPASAATTNHRVPWPSDGRYHDSNAAAVGRVASNAVAHRTTVNDRRHSGSVEPQAEEEHQQQQQSRRRTYADVEVSWCATNERLAAAPIREGRSKLDLAEERHARLGPDAVSESSDDGDEDEEEEERDCRRRTSRYSRLLNGIAYGPPLPLDSSKEKLSFMETVGLITQKRKRMLETDKFLKRHRVLRGLCVTPPDPLPEDSEPPTPWYLLIGENDSSDLATVPERRSPAADFDQKVKYMRTLDLREVSDTQRDELKQILSAVIDEKLRRNGYPTLRRENDNQVACDRFPRASIDTEANDIANRGTKRKLSESDDSTLAAASNPSKRFASTSLLHESSPTDSRIAPSCGTKCTSPPVPPTSNHHRHTPDPSSPKDHSRRTPVNHGMLKLSNARDFAQEFHEAVLQQTQLQSGSRPSSKSAGATSVDSETTTAYRESEFSIDNDRQRRMSEATDSSLPFRGGQHEQSVRWPGVEALMVAYERHREEHKLEYNVLQEHCLRLKKRNQDLSSTAKSLRLRMADLYKVKKDSDDDRQISQQAIDSLKGFLKQLR